MSNIFFLFNIKLATFTELYEYEHVFEKTTGIYLIPMHFIIKHSNLQKTGEYF